ncbi:MAG: hypothetical protein OSA97_05870 [Nevskia sp.]|nr:hypothetical protein [Nevskia sp.]
MHKTQARRPPKPPKPKGRSHRSRPGYTRAEALRAEVLHDVGEICSRDPGVAVNTAISTRAYEAFVDWSDADSKAQIPQDVSGRLWDVLYAAHRAIRDDAHGQSSIDFTIAYIPRDGRTRRPRLGLLKVVHGFDRHNAVLTILLPDEYEPE